MNFLKGVLLILLIFLVSLLTGCFQKIELEEQAYVVVLGIDQSSDGNMEVTYQVGNPQVGSSDRVNAEGEPASRIITLKAPDLTTARDLANIAISRRLTFTHLKVLVVSEQFMKSNRALALIDILMRDDETKQTLDLIVSKEKADKFIKNNKPELETRPHKHYEFMAKRWKETGLVPESTIAKYFPRILDDAGLFLAVYASTKEMKSTKEGEEDDYLPGEVYEKGGNNLEMIGSAVIKEGRMIGTLTGEETRLSLLLRPHHRKRSMLVTYPDPLNKNYRIAVQARRVEDTKVEMNLKGEFPKIKVIVPLSMKILGISSGIDYVENFKKQELLRKSIEKNLEKKTEELIKKTQQEFKAEPFRWYIIARKHFWTLKEYKDYDWMHSYPYADIKVDFKIKLTDFGRQFRPFDINRIKD